MPARKIDFLLLGGGLASATAAETLRREGADGSILIVSADTYPPYHRPPLSKQFLVQADAGELLPIFPERFYPEHAIELLLATRVVAVNDKLRTVLTDRGEEIGYGKLLIATGGSANPLPVPGAGLAGVHSLRTRADAAAVRESALAAKRAVVVGGSFLAIEVAASLSQMGLEVTLLERHRLLMSKLYAPALSEFFLQHCTAHGITVVFEAEIAEFTGRARLGAALTRSGRSIPCELAVLAIGITPETAFLERSGIAVDDGVIVDARLKASAEDVFAAGDVANFFDPVFGRRRRLEHWDNAIKHGRLAARNMLGRNLPCDETSYFFSDVFDLSFDVLGAPEEGEGWLGRGSLERRSFELFYLRDDRVRAAFALGRPAEETRAAEGLIRYRVNLGADKVKLADETFDLHEIPTQTVLILQGGGALGAFECGVVKALEEAAIFPDIVAGVSIGAFNGAIIASNPHRATAALESFWRDLAVQTPDLFHRGLTQSALSWQIVALGVPNFFKPRWLSAADGFGLLSKGWTSLYDTAPIRDLIARYVDFPSLKSSPVRLLVSAVNVETAELEMFDSYVDELTPDHILASGSLPPGFGWTTIGDKHYWDGGIISNSPLDLVVDRCGAAGKRVFIVDLFAGKKPLPTNLLEVMARRDEIVFAERIRNDMHVRELGHEFRALVEEMIGWLGPEDAARIRHRPRFIQLMGHRAQAAIVRIVREGEMGERASRDYDFSAAAVTRNRAEGYRLTQEALRRAPQEI